MSRTSDFASFRFVLTLCLLAATTPGHALTSFCVHDAQELYTALNVASNSFDTPVIINLRKGTYDAANATGAFGMVQVHSNQLVAISGGWYGDNGECTQHSNDPSATVLLGNASRRTLFLATSNANPNSGNNLYVSDLTLRNPTGTGISACLNAKVTPGGNSFTAQRLQFDQCVSIDSSVSTVVGFFNDGGQLTVDNVVARNGQASFNGGIGVNSLHGGYTRLSQLSITANKADIGSANIKASGLVLYTDSNGSSMYVGNSVIWGNQTDADTKDLSVYGPGIHLSRVHYGGISGTPDSNVGATQGDPGFVAPGDAHLRSNSLLVDTGDNNPEGGTGSYDADGRTRVQGAAVDVGAFEWSDTIFKHGFN